MTLFMMLSKSTLFLGKCNIVNIIGTLCTLYALSTATTSPAFLPVADDSRPQSRFLQHHHVTITTSWLPKPQKKEHPYSEPSPRPMNQSLLLQALTQSVFFLMTLLFSMPLSKSLAIFPSTSHTLDLQFSSFVTSLQMDGKWAESFAYKRDCTSKMKKCNCFV